MVSLNEIVTVNVIIMKLGEEQAKEGNELGWSDSNG